MALHGRQIGMSSASQTPREQDEDVASSFKDFKRELESSRAQKFVAWQASRVDCVKTALASSAALCFTKSHYCNRSHCPLPVQEGSSGRSGQARGNRAVQETERYACEQDPCCVEERLWLGRTR